MLRLALLAFAVAGAAALQLDAQESPSEEAHCLESVLKPQATFRGDSSCPAKFYMFDVSDPSLDDCYGKYISDEELKKWTEFDENSHHAGPIFVAKYLPMHRCAVSDPKKADLFVVPPFLPQWNKNFDDKDTVCQAKVLRLASHSDAYYASGVTGHSNFVVLNWWKGREQGQQTALFRNATFVGKDCKSEKCDDPFVGWPYFDNTPGSFLGGGALRGIQGREKLAVGVWGSRRGGDSQRRPLEAALKKADADCEFRAPGDLEDHGASIFELYKHSKFCINPRGDSLSRRSLSTCVLAGSIPVIMVDGLNLPFEHVLDYNKFSVRFAESTNPQHVLDGLRSMPSGQVAQLQRNAVCVRRAFLYDARTLKDAIAPGGLLDFLLADIAHVSQRRSGWKRPA